MTTYNNSLTALQTILENQYANKGYKIYTGYGNNYEKFIASNSVEMRVIFISYNSTTPNQFYEDNTMYLPKESLTLYIKTDEEILLFTNVLANFLSGKDYSDLTFGDKRIGVIQWSPILDDILNVIQMDLQIC